MEIVQIVIDSLSEPLIGGTTVAALAALLIIKKIKSKKVDSSFTEKTTSDFTLSGKEFELNSVIDDTTQSNVEQTTDNIVYTTDEKTDYNDSNDENSLVNVNHVEKQPVFTDNQPKSIWDNHKPFTSQTSSLASTMAHVIKEPTDTSSKELIHSAINYDYLEDTENALAKLTQAYSIEDHSREKLRIKIIINDYKKTFEHFQAGNLSTIVSKLPSFHREVVSDSVEDVLPNNISPNIVEDSFTINNNSSSFIQEPSLSSLLTKQSNYNINNAGHLGLENEQITIESRSEHIEPPKSLLKKASGTQEIDNQWIDLPGDDIPVLAVVIENDAHISLFQEKKSDFDSNLVPLTTLEDDKLQDKKLGVDNETTDNDPVTELDQFLIDLRNEAEMQDKSAEDGVLQVDNILSQFNISPIEEENDISLENINSLAIKPKEQNINKNNLDISHIMTDVYKDVHSQEKVFSVWVNWMMETSGKQEMKRSIVHLNDKWGTKSALEQLTVELNKEAGDENTWVVLSVFPVEE